ncbi:pyruvate formate lyase family protein [Ruminococcus sp. 5_1_39BFAA]|uniref:pyruvate formate lyase family protein n=1 Tax=Ruminococcus sp. 5_1_39BFAA TaxID=457412 RepID=UPI003564D358
MRIQEIYTAEEITNLAKERFQEERALNHLEGWFLAREIAMECDETFKDEPDCLRIAKTLVEVMKRIPLTLGDYHVFAGTQDDAFARSYALINPAFQVSSFCGYCDPTAVFGDIDPIGDITEERIAKVKAYYAKNDFAEALTAAYAPAEKYTAEAAFFIEQVTGHVIPDVRHLLEKGALYVQNEITEKQAQTEDEGKKQYYEAMKNSIQAMLILAERYAAMAEEKAAAAAGKAKERYTLMAETLKTVPAKGAENLYQAIQSFVLIWQTMTVEQTPNPFAFSVGNADRIFEPYRAKEDLDRDLTASLLKHMLVFFNVADRSWAISQNLIIGGRDTAGNDLTNPTSYALFDAYFDMNLPQPILSVKLHKNTPDKLYEEMGRFFFTPGVLTPSLFNDDALFEVLKNNGVAEEDLADYSVAGCQEPLIMGKDNGNTTNSWLNLPKVLELVLQGGKSEITGTQIGKTREELGYDNNLDLLKNIREVFYKELDFYIDEMVKAANGASRAISLYQVPFLSAMMGGIESGVDMRDTKEQGTKYNGSGCLIHGLSVMADSFIAIDTILEERPQDADRFLEALRTNFEQDEEMHQYLLQCDKFGNNIERVDREAKLIADRVSEMVASKKNYLGNPFRPDYSTPSTHLMYGYWVGATPDGRKSREMLNYGVDPLYGEASGGLGMRMLSNRYLPFETMNGGYASHFGINPGYFRGVTMEEKGLEFKNKIFTPLFFNTYDEKTVSPFYLYVNVTTPEMLRKVLADPKKYAPSGVYIVRIHGTFVNFLDLSPEIQEDIIKRLDPGSTSLSA